jgi:hypothetical protein
LEIAKAETYKCRPLEHLMHVGSLEKIQSVPTLIWPIWPVKRNSLVLLVITPAGRIDMDHSKDPRREQLKQALEDWERVKKLIKDRVSAPALDFDYQTPSFVASQ